MDGEAIWSAVESLRNIFTIVLALALGEAFKQFVADRADGDDGKEPVRWWSLPALASFLLLLVPFFHGMVRHLYDVYKSPSRPQPFGGFLLADIAAFTTEAGLFFVMSRALRLEQWRRFYTAVGLIMLVDAVWAGVVWLCCSYRPTILPWFWLNIGSIVVIGTLLGVCSRDSKRAPIVAVIAMGIRTVIDYSCTWSFYFPSDSKTS